MNTKETRYDTDGKYAGHTTYEYTDNGQLERERTYNKNRRILTEEKYAYDTSGNVVTHSYKDYTDNSKTYTETYSYSGNLPIQVRKTDKNGTVTEVEEIHIQVPALRVRMYIMTGMYCSITVHMWWMVREM